MMPRDPKIRTLTQLLGVVVVMASLAWAAIPLYDWFCRVTGFGGTTGVAESSTGEILDRTMVVKFDASKERDMPWDFRPVEREMTIRIGETGLAFYEAHNPTDEPVAGSASYNVAPFAAGGYFAKIDCFCFEQQVLGPGETVMMPVTFFVDPAIVDDAEAGRTPHITLSYTFHRIEIPEDYTTAATGALDAAAETTEVN